MPRKPKNETAEEPVKQTGPGPEVDNFDAFLSIINDAARGRTKPEDTVIRIHELGETITSQVTETDPAKRRAMLDQIARELVSLSAIYRSQLGSRIDLLVRQIRTM